MPSLSCCDPYNRHGKKVRKCVRLVPESLVQAVNHSRLLTGDYLSDNCRKDLTKDPSSLPDEEENTSSESDNGSVSEDVESLASSLSDVEICRQETNQVLPLVGISPIAGTGKNHLTYLQNLWS